MIISSWKLGIEYRGGLTASVGNGAGPGALIMIMGKELAISCPGRIFGIISQDLSVFQVPPVGLHVVIVRFLFFQFEVYSIDSSNTIRNFHEVLNCNWLLFLKLKPVL